MSSRRTWIAVALVWFSGVASAGHVHVGEGHVPPPPDRSLNPSVEAGAGLDGFITGSARDRFEAGPSWNIRFGVLDHDSLRLELVYAGSSQPAADGDGRLVAHGVHALLRVNVAPGRVFEPFFYAGGGWSRFAIDSEMSDLQSPDDVLEIPLGLGIARRFGRFVVDARAGVSISTGADLVPASGTSSSAEAHNMHRFGVRANIGLEL